MRTSLFALAALFTVAVHSATVTIDLTQADQPNALYTAELNDEVIVKLNENPTTGYSWILINRG